MCPRRPEAELISNVPLPLMQTIEPTQLLKEPIQCRIRIEVVIGQPIRLNFRVERSRRPSVVSIQR